MPFSNCLWWCLFLPVSLFYPALSRPMPIFVIDSNNLNARLTHKCILFRCCSHISVIWGSLLHFSVVLSKNWSPVFSDEFAYIKQMPSNVQIEISIFQLFGCQMVLRQHSSDLDLRFFSHTSISWTRLTLSLPSYNKDNTVNWITMPYLLVGNFQIRKHK